MAMDVKCEDYCLRMKILSFSPHAGLDLHSLPEAFLLEGLSLKGWSVDIVNCSGLLSSYCAVMASIGLNDKASALYKSAVCVGCRRRRNQIRSGARNQVFINLDQYVTSTDIDAWNGFERKVRSDNWLDIELMGIPVGQYAAYEFILTHKIQETELPPNLLMSLKGYLRSVVLTALAAPRILQDRKPDRILAYNTLYGVNRVWKHLATQQGIPCYSIHGGSNDNLRHDSLMMYRDDAAQINIARTRQAAIALENSPSVSELQGVSRHLTSKLFEARDTFTYSLPYCGRPSSEVRHLLRLEPCNPVFLVALSSPDERRAAEMSGLRFPGAGMRNFDNQLEWLIFLLGVASQYPAWQFIVRVHPRMYPNHRDLKLSPEAAQIEAVLASAPDNVRANVPSDQLSLLDLLSVVDVGITRTSTVGLEMAALGYPVISADPTTYFAGPKSAFLAADDSEKLVDMMKVALAQGFRASPMILSYRYLAFLHFHVARTVPWRSAPLTVTTGAQGTESAFRHLYKFMKGMVINSRPDSLLAANYLTSEFIANSPRKAPIRVHESDLNWIAPFEEVLLEGRNGLHESSKYQDSRSRIVSADAARTDELIFHVSNLRNIVERVGDSREENSLVNGLSKVQAELQTLLIGIQ